MFLSRHGYFENIRKISVKKDQEIFSNDLLGISPSRPLINICWISWEHFMNINGFLRFSSLHWSNILLIFWNDLETKKMFYFNFFFKYDWNIPGENMVFIYIHMVYICIYIIVEIALFANKQTRNYDKGCSYFLILKNCKTKLKICAFLKMLP